MGHDHGEEDHGHSHNSGHSHANGHSPGGQDLEAPLLGDERTSREAELEDEQRRLKQAVYFALFMMFVEIFGGILANSLAIITDAAHMLSDVGGFIVSLVCLQLATQGRTKEYTYGFKQAEVLGALLSIAIVWALTACLLVEAAKRFVDLQEIDGCYMFWISALGFLVNIALMKVLGHGHAHGGHGHSHGGHGHDDHEDDDEGSLAMRAALAHVIGDIVQSLGVCLAALCIWFQPFDVGFTETGVSKWNYADPCCTVMFGILVLNTTKSTLTQTINSLMVKAPENINQHQLVAKIRQCHGVVQIHDLHLWRMGSKDVLLTAHLLISSKDDCTKTLRQVIEVAHSFGVAHPTFQLEIQHEFDCSIEHGHQGGVCGSPLAEEKGHGGDDCCDGHAHADSGHAHGHAEPAAPSDQGHGHSHEAASGGHKEHGHDGGGCCDGHGPAADSGHAHGHAEPKKEQGHGHSHDQSPGHGHGH